MILVNGKRLEKEFIFSGGEVQIRLPYLEDSEFFLITTSINSSDKLMQLLLVNNALQKKFPLCKVVANIGYLPYARQDRVCFEGEALSKEVIIQLLGTGNFAKVLVNDVHSAEPKLPKEFVEAHQAYTVDRGQLEKADLLICPDKGAIKKIEFLADLMELPVVYAEKERCPDTGYIKEITISGTVAHKRVLIVDDICDGGMTFILLSKKLLGLGAREVNLHVTHGIFSKGLRVLEEAGITNITYTIDLYKEQQ